MSSAAEPAEAAVASAERRRELLVELYREARDCTRCPLAETRTNVVFGNGNANADLMFVGEAPGAEEDRRGLPFVGRAGKLLDALLAGVSLSRDDVFVTNVLMCRPPGNRDPQPAEIDSCRPYLERKVELIEPRVIGTLGNFATKLLTANPTGITRVRGTPQVHVLGGRALFVMPLLHPAAALRTPALRETLAEDFAKLGDLIAADPPGPAPATELEPEPARAEAEAAAAPAPGMAGRPPADDQLDLFA